MSKTKAVVKGLGVRMDSEVTRCIRQHARAHMKTEVCGVLIGEQRDDVVEIQAMIDAQQAAQAGTHVTFTQDAWEEIYRVKDQKYPDHRIVGWYHSHPGFGVFLSEHDTFIHKNFFSSPNQVAWVFDPHTDEEGCFGWLDGQIKRVETLSIVDRNGDGIERTPKERSHYEADEDESGDLNRLIPQPGPAAKAAPPWLRIGVSVASYLAVAVAGFFVSIYLFPPVYLAVVQDPRTGEQVGVEMDPRDGRPMLGKDGKMLVVPIHIDQLASPPPPAAPSAPQPAPPPATGNKPPNPPPGGSK